MDFLSSAQAALTCYSGLLDLPNPSFCSIVSNSNFIATLATVKHLLIYSANVSV